MYIDPFRAPEFSEICKKAREYQTNFLVAGCRHFFGTLIAVVYTAGRSIVRFLNAPVLKPHERRG